MNCFCPSFPPIFNSSLFVSIFYCHHFSHLATLLPCHPSLPLTCWSPILKKSNYLVSGLTPEHCERKSHSCFPHQLSLSSLQRRFILAISSLILWHHWFPLIHTLLFNSWFMEKIHRYLLNFMPPNLQISLDLYPALFFLPVATKETKSMWGLPRPCLWTQSPFCLLANSMALNHFSCSFTLHPLRWLFLIKILSLSFSINKQSFCHQQLFPLTWWSPG